MGIFFFFSLTGCIEILVSSPDLIRHVYRFHIRARVGFGSGTETIEIQAHY